jgi:hypothetical protein
MIEAIQKFLSVPENARGITTTALSVFVVLAVTGMVVLTPSLLNYLLGAGVMCSALVLGKMKA